MAQIAREFHEFNYPYHITLDREEYHHGMGGREHWKKEETVKHILEPMGLIVLIPTSCSSVPHDRRPNMFYFIIFKSNSLPLFLWFCSLSNLIKSNDATIG